MSKEGVNASHVVLGVHGGTGIEKSKMTPDREKRIRLGLEAALRTGFSRLQETGNSIDAVETAVRSLEDCPEFNAGRGAVFNHEGGHELDAAIMEGKDRHAGAVAGVMHIKNPVSAARAVMEKSPHVFLMGQGAEDFARSCGVELVNARYFWTEERWQELQRAIDEQKKNPQSPDAKPHPRQWGTVGAVAVDRSGNLASATSTGGMTNKQFGRIGDTPIIGAGTYADNASAAISATGHGEYFIRFAAAHEIASLVKYKGLSLADATELTVQVLKKAGGEGAFIALDPKGHFSMARNCEGLYRGFVTKEGVVKVFVYET